jgi:hypothetical protein
MNQNTNRARHRVTMHPQSSVGASDIAVVGPWGLEPQTSTVSMKAALEYQGVAKHFQ